MTEVERLQARLARVEQSHGRHSGPAMVIKVWIKKAMTDQLMAETATPMKLKSEQERHAS